MLQVWHTSIKVLVCVLVTVSAQTASPGAELAATGFFPAFLASFMLILGSEVGDKTFFIAAILSMKHSYWVVFLGAISALVVMTILSAGMGVLLPSLLSKELTHYACVVLFGYFGVRLLYDVFTSDGSDNGENEELREVELELAGSSKPSNPSTDIEDGDNNHHQQASSPGSHESSWLTNTMQKWMGTKSEHNKVFIQSFMMTFLAEWGDRSQIATIALATTKNVIGVTLGGVIGHCLCTGVAVIGGKLLASKISERHVNMAGGCLFLFFAVTSLIMGP